MHKIIIDGLLLPFRIMFQPDSFRREVHALAPDLAENYSLLKARRYWRDPAFRRGIMRLGLQWLVTLSYSVATAAIVQGLGYHVDWAVWWAWVAVGMAVGVTFGMTLGVALGVALGVTMGMLRSADIVVIGGADAIKMADVAMGALFGVTLIMGMGVAMGMAVGVAGSTGGNLAVGVGVGVAVGVTVGVTAGVAVGVAVGVVSILTTSHLIFYPFQYALAGWVGRGLKRHPQQTVRTWRWSPLAWDEVQPLPFPPLFSALKQLYRSNQAQAEAILAQVAAHRYQNWLARWVRIDLAADDAQGVRSVHALAALERSLSWLPAQADNDPALQLLAAIRSLSGEARSAVESDSSTNRVRRYAEALDTVDRTLLNLSEPRGWRLRRERALMRRLRPVLGQWRIVIDAAHRQAQADQRRLEPIPQVYVGDGKPILPTGRRDDAVPFKGRAALFRQLEQAVGGSGSERQTLLLYGQRRTGKTSILLQLARRLGSRCIPVFLDGQSEQLSGANSEIGLLEGIARFVREAVQERDIGLPALEAAELQRDPYPAFGRWLDQVEQTLGEHTLLLCFDEFEALEEAIEERRLDGRILNMVRSIVQHRQRIGVLLAGSHQLDELSPRWSSSLINTRLLPISFLDRADAHELIVQPVADFPAIYQPAAVERILAATHCQPLLIQSLCAELVNLMNRAQRQPPQSLVEVADVEQAIPVIFERSKAYFDDLWRSQTGGRSGQSILEQIAHTPSNSYPLASLRTLSSDQTALREALAVLQRREIITRNDGQISITVPLVAQYIRQITTL